MQQKTLIENIDQFGCHVIHVAEEHDLPPFAYSIGIQHTQGAPEVIVVGLKQALAHSVVNQYNDRVRKGERFADRKRYSGFIEGFEIQIARVHKAHYDEYLGQACKFYRGSNFDVLQIIWPTTDGFWPWDTAAGSWFRDRQPVLTSDF